MKEELCEWVVEIRRVSDRVIAVVLVFEDDVLRQIFVYALHCVRNTEENFYM